MRSCGRGWGLETFGPHFFDADSHLPMNLRSYSLRVSRRDRANARACARARTRGREGVTAASDSAVLAAVLAAVIGTGVISQFAGSCHDETNVTVTHLETGPSACKQSTSALAF